MKKICDALGARFISRAALGLTLAGVALVASPALRAEDPAAAPPPQEKARELLKPPAPVGEAHPVTGRKPSGVMGVMGAPWLERAKRAEEEPPEIVIGAMELKPNDVVVDLGCGSGFFTRRIAPLVPEGKVYGVDIQPGMIELLKGDIEKNKLTNVIPTLSTDTDPKLPKGEADWILLVDVYHEFDHPEPMLAKMLESLAPGGKVALVEYRLLGPTAEHIKLEHRMSVKQVLAEWQPAGFQLVDLIEDLPAQHLFIFERRPDCGAAAK